MLLSFSIKHNDHVRNLDVKIEANLNFQHHITIITKTAFYHLKNISNLRGFFSQSDSEKLVHTFISSRLNYRYALFAGLQKRTLGRLQPEC